MSRRIFKDEAPSFSRGNIEGHQLLRFRGIQGKIENLKVFLHSVRVGGFGDDDDSAIDGESNEDLGRRLGVTRGDGGDGSIGQQIRNGAFPGLRWAAQGRVSGQNYA